MPATPPASSAAAKSAAGNRPARPLPMAPLHVVIVGHVDPGAMT